MGDDMSDTHDAEYAGMWHTFTRLMRAGVVGALAVLIFMAITLL